MPVTHGVAEFEVRVSKKGDATVVSVRGELDLGTVGDVRAVVGEQAGVRRLVVDLREVAFMDSSAVHLLDELMRTFARVTFRVPETAAGRQVLVMTGMLDRLPLELT